MRVTTGATSVWLETKLLQRFTFEDALVPTVAAATDRVLVSWKEQYSGSNPVVYARVLDYQLNAAGVPLSWSWSDTVTVASDSADPGAWTSSSNIIYLGYSLDVVGRYTWLAPGEAARMLRGRQQDITTSVGESQYPFNRFFHLDGHDDLFVAMWVGTESFSPYRPTLLGRLALVGASGGPAAGLTWGTGYESDMSDTPAPSGAIATGQDAYTDYTNYPQQTLIWENGFAVAVPSEVVGAWALVTNAVDPVTGESTINSRYLISDADTVIVYTTPGGDEEGWAEWEILLDLEQPRSSVFNLDFANGTPVLETQPCQLDVYPTLDFVTRPGIAIDSSSRLHLTWFQSMVEDQTEWVGAVAIDLYYRYGMVLR